MKQQQKPNVLVYSAQEDKSDVIRRQTTRVELIARALTRSRKISSPIFTPRKSDETEIRQEQLLTETELRKFIKVSESTLYRMRKEGCIPYFLLRVSSRKKIIRYRLSDVLSYLKSVNYLSANGTDTGQTDENGDIAADKTGNEQSRGDDVQ